MCKIQPGHNIANGYCLSPNCDLDLGSRWLCDVHDTSSYYRELLCEVISKSIQACERYSMDKKLWTDRQTDGQTVTLTLGVGGWVMYMTHHLVMKNNCVK